MRQGIGLGPEAFLSASRPTRCEFAGRDRYGRFVGTCFRADGKDVNRWLIESGNAVDRDTDKKGLYASRSNCQSNGCWNLARTARTCLRGARPAG